MGAYRGWRLAWHARGGWGVWGFAFVIRLVHRVGLRHYGWVGYRLVDFIYLLAPSSLQIGSSVRR